MKKIPTPVMVLLLVVALYFAYKSFKSSFFPREGLPPGERPGMPALAQKQMEESMKRKSKPDDKKKGVSKESVKQNLPVKKGGE
jgi:hypothetical protein